MSIKKICIDEITDINLSQSQAVTCCPTCPYGGTIVGLGDKCETGFIGMAQLSSNLSMLSFTFFSNFEFVRNTGTATVSDYCFTITNETLSVPGNASTCCGLTPMLTSTITCTPAFTFSNDCVTGTVIKEFTIDNICIPTVTCIETEEAINMNFFEDFEDEPLGDVGPETNDTVWAGVSDDFGFVVNIDTETIRSNTPESRFGNQLLKFDNPFPAGSPSSETINQVSRQFNSTNLGIDFPTPIILEFDVRTIQSTPSTDGIHGEVDIGLSRAGRFWLVTFGSQLFIALAGGAGFKITGGALTIPFFYGPINYGQWFNIVYGLDINKDLYTFIEIDGTRFDNSGQGWDAGVNRLGNNIQDILLIQGSDDANQEGIYIDNISINSV